MYGGQCTKEYFLSSIDLERELTRNNIDHTWLITSNESLIPRARNTAVARFINDPELQQYEVFMFIDADIEFCAEDVAKLYKLVAEDGHRVATAAYPMKREGSDVTAWKDGKLVDLDQFTEPTPVDYAGTGFLMIKRDVFEQLRESQTHLLHQEGNVGEVYDYFNCGVSDDREAKDRFYVSEDYAFCDRCSNHGIDIVLEPSIRLGHVGRRVYR